MDMAYETPDGVYLEVSKVDGYGLLAAAVARLAAVGRPGRGERGEALAARLRPVEEGQGGRAAAGTHRGGRAGPGWHTECVVMSLDLLGEGFDLHGGGQDLKFPHHENERAQAVADGKAFAQHWMHNGWVEVEGTKMSKSLGNFTTLPDLLAALRRPRLPAARAPRALPLADRGDARDARRRREGAGPTRRAGAALRGGRPARADATDGYRRRGRRRRRRASTRARWPRSGRAWTTTSTRRARWPASSSWSRRRTPPPTPATRTRAAPGPHRGGARWRRSGCPSGPESRRGRRGSRPGWWPNATRPAGAKDFARADALRDELVARGWTVEDTPSGTAIRR